MGFLDSLLGLKTNAASNEAAGQAQAYQQRVGTANEAMLRGLNIDGQTALNAGANDAIGAINWD